MRNTRILLVAALAMAIGTPSCAVWPFHKKKATPVPPPAPAPTAPAVRPKPREVAVPAPPDISAKEPDLHQAGPAVPGETLPPAPRRAPKKARTHEDADAAPPAPEPEAPAAAVPAPQFEQVLTPEQTKAYSEEIERNIADAQRAVAMVENRRLNGEQTTYLARVRAFIDQANEARKADLFRARNLSERARVLAEDLLKSVQ
ncbi:MAG TPA: hypothetical protein VN893_13180 [Bryobacteraceae bacterium]|nr:hypothetical protein [Bryobacteraceae bacterium]